MGVEVLNPDSGKYEAFSGARLTRVGKTNLTHLAGVAVGFSQADRTAMKQALSNYASGVPQKIYGKTCGQSAVTAQNGVVTLRYKA